MESGITAKNVNSKLDQLRIINQPHGGMELEVAWGVANHAGTESGAAAMAHYTPGFRAINDALRRLLVGGIVPMNKKGLLQADVKASNVLVAKGKGSLTQAARAGEPIQRVLEDMTPAEASDDGHIHARLIDWGLAIRFNPAATSGVPGALVSRVLMFNAPVSIILFDTELQDLMSDMVSKLPSSPVAPVGDSALAHVVARAVYSKYRTVMGKHGHHQYLAQLVSKVYPPLLVGEEGVWARPQERALCAFQAVVVEYLAAVIEKFMSADGSFQAGKFFRDVFSKNMDIYGLVMCYVPLIDAHGATAIEQWERNPLSSGVARVIAEYCFSPRYATTPIPVDALVADLGKLNHESGASPQPTSPNPGPTRKRPALRKPPGASSRRKSPARAARSSKGKRSSGRAFSWPAGKRCPKGTRRNKKDGRCHPR